MVDKYILYLLVIGLVLLLATLGSGWISRLPLSYSLIYLVIGISLGPYGMNLIKIRPDAEFLERVTEFVVIVSVYSCGLKMNRPLTFRAWNSTGRLIGFLMPISILGVAAIAYGFMGFNWGAAVLLGAILAPTDPVLASEVQLSHIEDHDELRFGLTSEGGLNDALAFPFVYFGLYFLKDHNWEKWFKYWVGVDVIWAIVAGVGMGIIVAYVVVWLDKQLQKRRPVDDLMQDFISLSTILVTYSLTEIVNGYGFIAVFVAGMMIQRSYRNPEKPLSQLHFTERIEKLMEVGLILLLGSMLRVEPMLTFAFPTLLIGGFLLFLIRPIGCWLSTIGGSWSPKTRFLFGWFGIRGVGSLYYLTYAFGHGLKGFLGEEIGWIVYSIVVISMVLHGITATPLMKYYQETPERELLNS